MSDRLASMPTTYAVGYEKCGLVRIVSPYMGETHENRTEAVEFAREEELTRYYRGLTLFEVRPIRNIYEGEDRE